MDAPLDAIASSAESARVMSLTILRIASRSKSLALPRNLSRMRWSLPLRDAMMMQEWSYETQTRFLRELEKLEPPPLPRSIVPQRADLGATASQGRRVRGTRRGPPAVRSWNSRRRTSTCRPG